LQRIDAVVAEIYGVQGGCEKIKNTPFPHDYGAIAEVLIRTYAVLLPMAIIDALHWWAIPVAILVCLAFKLVDEVGRSLEDPFTSAANALPLAALCRTIERDLWAALAAAEGEGGSGSEEWCPGERGL
jgi:putative membrane protein